MTDNEIIKALDWCEQIEDIIFLSNVKATKYTFALQSFQTIKQVLKDYNRQQAENEGLTRKYDLAVAEREANIKAYIELTEELNKARAEIERLEAILGGTSKVLTETCAGVRVKAIKEFAERLIRNITINNTNDGYLDYAVDYNCLVDDINDLVEEMECEG